MGASEIINLILSIATITVAVVALFISIKQIKMSNKRSLFKERTQKYIKLEELVMLYGGCREYLDKAAMMPDFLFTLLTKDLLLVEDNFFVGRPLSKEESDKFLKEMENLKALALEISLLWKAKNSELASAFVNSYENLVMALFKLQVKIKTMENRRGYNEDALKILTKDVSLNEDIKIIEDIYTRLKNENILNILKEQIRLK